MGRPREASDTNAPHYIRGDKSPGPNEKATTALVIRLRLAPRPSRGEGRGARGEGGVG